jgi:hypothetical protein
MQRNVILISILVFTSVLSLLVPSIKAFEGFGGYNGLENTWISFPTREKCSTRNMSNDIRGDIPIKRVKWAINNVEWGPLNPEECQNRPLM